jgi:hypothetical protein
MAKEDTATGHTEPVAIACFFPVVCIVNDFPVPVGPDGFSMRNGKCAK